MAKRITTVQRLLWRYPAWRIAIKLIDVDWVNKELKQSNLSHIKTRLFKGCLQIACTCCIILIKVRPKLPSKWVVIGVPSSDSNEDFIEICAMRKKDIVNYEFDFPQLKDVRAFSSLSESEMSPDLKEWAEYEYAVIPRADLGLMRRREALGSAVDMDNVNEYGALRFAAAVIRDMLSFGFKEAADAKTSSLDQDWDLTLEEWEVKIMEEIKAAPVLKENVPYQTLASETDEPSDEETEQESDDKEWVGAHIYIYRVIKDLQAYWKKNDDSTGYI